MAKVTQKQIAEAAGVSQSIVSKVLRGQIPRNMSKAKIDAIHKAAEEMGYTQPKAKPQKPAQPAKPKRAPSPKFGATPQGDPLHKYGKQWRQAVAADTGVMPKGDFTSLKLGEQRQVMRVLNNIDKDGKKRTDFSKKNLKANQAANQLWKGVALGASAVGVPLSVAGLVNKFTDLVESSAEIARFATTAGIDPDKMLAMTRQAEIYGVDAGGFQSAFASIQSLSTQMQKGENQKLLEPFASLGISAPLGEVQNRALQGDVMGVLKAINQSYQAGDIKTQDLTELMRRLGADAFTSLMVGGDFGKVINAKAMQGAGDAAIELSKKLETLKHKFEDIFINNFDEINSGIDKFIGWLDDTDFTHLTNLFGDLATAVEKILRVAGIETESSLKEDLASFRKSRDAVQPGSIAAWKYDQKITEIETKLKEKYGYDSPGYTAPPSPIATPAQLSQAAKENGDGAVATASAVRSGRLDINVSVAISSDGKVTDQQATDIAKAVQDAIDKRMQSEKNKISESYQ